MNALPKVERSASGAAALSICESLLLALGDLKILSEQDVIGIMKDATAAHRNAEESPDEPGFHAEVACILEGIVAGGNSVRRP
ncbi:MAG: hypothetical protein JWN07_750 [Hyphomicrobiales bacterium]|nr:hypothetical protein [Hyphomicrobiales bacterium]